MLYTKYYLRNTTYNILHTNLFYDLTCEKAGFFRKNLHETALDSRFARVIFETSLNFRYDMLLLRNAGHRTTMADVTRILNAIEQGDAQATEELLPLVYEELRLLAAQKMRSEPPGQTLEGTALVHEAYLRLVQAKDQNWNSRGHFFKAAAEAMRRILVESARRKERLKRGGGRQREADFKIDTLESQMNLSINDLMALDEALTRLENEDSALADVVRLHCFAGLPLVQIAEILDVSGRTVERHWSFARAWLRRELRAQQ
jgi:RNA polymerase sigma factor (TIGR02999 family)